MRVENIKNQDDAIVAACQLGIMAYLKFQKRGRDKSGLTFEEFAKEFTKDFNKYCFLLQERGISTNPDDWSEWHDEWTAEPEFDDDKSSSYKKNKETLQ